MDRRAHVVVVGAGIVGCAIAYELARRGARVQVVDRRDIGAGATQASAGVLAPYIEAHDGHALLELASRSLELYDEFVSNVVEDSGATVQYVRSGTLEVALDEAGLAHLANVERMCSGRGVEAELLDAAAAREAEPHLAAAVRGGLRIGSHGFVGARDLTAALRSAAIVHEVSFHTATAATRVAADGEGVRVETAGESFVCDTAVLAAGSWSGRIEVEGAEPLPVRPVRGQLLHLGWPAPALGRVVWAPGCYVVPWSDGSVLVGATVEEVGFDERATVAGIQALIDATGKVMPAVSEASFVTARVGLRPATPDRLPVIGRSTAIPGLVYASGHFRYGVLLAPLTAALVADIVVDGGGPSEAPAPPEGDPPEADPPEAAGASEAAGPSRAAGAADAGSFLGAALRATAPSRFGAC
ncbi:MAG: glycine oxidase ThiO [Acidobacteria bacterium]|nr:glycine oxidase ThiO [Acidobacteriota bacterium]